ncbi:protein TolR [Parendozoicomonas haliclonae]|uniref:Tol-Pal system protein TolR n=1 Tax=Parendozoicomonas haliclonae TaxID=1960125 RepID=A0A1X7AFR2_9GAMM|nr:protein TolR [Parendozoicomonas haliclonae]SMA36477.1 Biopolymer transport protein ExbD [Parendozoicomonas haliclonae]
MARKSGRRKPMSEINMVPFIDIMMVMLVAFMVSSPMFTQGVQVELPKTDSNPVEIPKGEEPLVVSIKPDGSYYLSLESTGEKSLSLSEMSDKVSKIKKARPSTMVLVKGDKAASYGAVVEAMAVLQKAGVSDVGLITEPGELN